MSDAVNDTDRMRRRLGDILIQRGAITEAQLHAALEHQETSGTPLARILVDSGLVASHTVAMALAEQSGGALKTEYGFAIAGGSPPAGPAAPPPGDVVPLRRLAPVAPEVLPAPVAAPELDELRAELEAANQALAESNRARIESETELARAHSDLRAAKGAQAEAEALRARVETLSAELEEAMRSGAEHATIVEELRRDLHTAVAAAQADAPQLRQRVADLAETEASLRDELRAALAVEPPLVSGARSYPDTRHILFVPNGDHYELVERAGPAPAAGSIVDLSGNRTFHVLRIGPSPFPGGREACVYLEPAGR